MIDSTSTLKNQPNTKRSNTQDTNHVIGWCDSGDLGLMMINECPKCGTRYRFHGTTTGRWNLDLFIGDLYTQLSIQK